jgi:YfiH family protein
MQMKKTRKVRRRAAVSKPSAKNWKEKRSDGLTLLVSPTLTRVPWMIHGFSTRSGGASKLDGKQRVLNLGFTEWDKREAVEANRKSFLKALGAPKMTLVTLKQVHSDAIHVITAAPAAPLSGDALITRTPGLLLAVQTADCVPILLADTRNCVVAAVHAGWRGTLARIVAKAVGRMQMEFGTKPADVVAAIGPSIGRCSFEVGPEVARAFAGQFANARDWFDVPRELASGMPEGEIVSGESPNPLKWLSMMPPGHDPPPPTVQLDLIAANRWQLMDAGVRDKNISASGLCTVCRNDLLFSHRREQGRTGRMLAAIGIRG